MADYIVWPLAAWKHDLYIGEAFTLQPGFALTAGNAKDAALAAKTAGTADRYAVLGPEGLQVFDLAGSS